MNDESMDRGEETVDSFLEWKSRKIDVRRRNDENRE